MESPCAVSLRVVGSFTVFTVGCCYVVEWVFCLLCDWIFHCVVRGTARHLCHWSEFLIRRILTPPRAYCVICTMYAAACSIRVVVSSALLYVPLFVCFILVGKRLMVVLRWGWSLSYSRLAGVLVGAGWLGYIMALEL